LALPRASIRFDTNWDRTFPAAPPPISL
jgi:hypothetical protein